MSAMLKNHYMADYLISLLDQITAAALKVKKAYISLSTKGLSVQKKENKNKNWGPDLVVKV